MPSAATFKADIASSFIWLLKLTPTMVSLRLNRKVKQSLVSCFQSLFETE